MLPRTLFDADHDSFRAQVKKFMREEVLPHNEHYAEQQYVDREIWTKAGALGFLCPTLPEEYGGVGADRRYSTILMEEQAYAGISALGWPLHSDIVAPYLLHYGSEAQKSHWLPKLASGETITAIAMTEPGTGSDLQGIKTTIREDGDDYILNGAKIFITNGYMADLVIVVAKMESADGGAKNISLILVEADRAGFTKGKPLKKVGMKGQDTCELFFTNVRVPKTNLLGKAGNGFVMLMKELAWERLIIAITAIAAAEAALDVTIDYVKQRKAFGKPIATFQNTRFKLAEMKSEVQMARTFVDRCLELEIEKKLGIEAAAAAKYLCSDLQCKVVDECVQLHGGYGYMLEYPIAQMYIDARAQRIYGGTNEIMKEIISRAI